MTSHSIRPRHPRRSRTIVIRVTGRGTHEGEFQGIPPTGAQVTATGVGIGRIQDGCIAEAWATYDALGLMPQLGAVPASERPPHG